MRLPVDEGAAWSSTKGPRESEHGGGSCRKSSAVTTRTELIGVEALATWLGVEIVFVRRLVAERRIPFLKIGKFVRFDPDEIAAWLDAQRVGADKERTARRGRL
jgi:excisionase family DNA binding protein